MGQGLPCPWQGYLLPHVVRQLSRLGSIANAEMEQLPQRCFRSGPCHLVKTVSMGRLSSMQCVVLRQIPWLDRPSSGVGETCHLVESDGGRPATGGELGPSANPLLTAASGGLLARLAGRGHGEWQQVTKPRCRPSLHHPGPRP